MIRKIKNDSGYSLVELIIVLAIIAVMSGLAMVSVSSIKTARATSSKETFNQELSTLQSMTKTQDSEWALKLERIDGKYNLIYGKSKNGSDFKEDSSKDREILDRVTIYYSNNGSSAGSEVSSMIIKFNKSDGSVKTGSGVYTFYKDGSNDAVGKVTLNQATGSHYTGS